MSRGKKLSETPVKTGEVVLSAIKKLTRNTGWTTRTIIKFIKMDYKFDINNVGAKVSRALKRGVKLGLLQVEHGRYRLSDISRLVKPMSSREIRMRSLPKRRRELPLRIRSCTPSQSMRMIKNKRTQ